MDEKLKRRKRNKDIVERMKKGDSLSSFTNMGSHFPPRPIIDKDKEAIKKLYGPDLKPVD